MKLSCLTIVMAWQALAQSLQIEAAADISPAQQHHPSAWQALAAQLHDNYTTGGSSIASCWRSFAVSLADGAEGAEVQDAGALADGAEVQDAEVADGALADGAEVPYDGGSSLYEPTENGMDDEEGRPLPLVVPDLAAFAVCDAETVRSLVADSPSAGISNSKLHTVIRSTLQQQHQPVKHSRFDKLSDALLMHPEFSATTTVQQLAEDTSMDRKTLPQHISLVASALIEADRFVRWLLEFILTSLFDLRQCLLYVEAGAYDETPMAFVVSDIDQHALDDTAASVPEHAAQVQVPSLPWRSDETKTTVIKLLQSSQEFGLLFEMHRGGLATPAADQRYLMVVGDSINWLQRIQDGKATTMLGALERTSAVTTSSASFANKIRLACNDDAKANPLTERLMVSRRSDNWLGWRWYCEVHKAATAFEWTFLLLEWYISGMLNLSLSLNDFSNLATFRMKMKYAIMYLITVRTQPLDEDAIRYKMTALRIWLGSGRKRSYKAMVLLKLLPGDWRLRDAIEIELANGESLNEKKEAVAEGVSMILAGTKVPEWPRHRWKGADLSAGVIGLMQSVHGLLSFTYRLWIADMPSSSSSNSKTMPNVDPMGDEQPAASDNENAAGDCEVGPEHALVAASGGQPADTDHAAADHTRRAHASKPGPEENSRFRSKAFAFTESDHLDYTFTIRLTMESLRVLLDSKLWVGSARWELHQRALAANASLSNSSSWPYRTFPLMEAALNTAEDSFFERLGHLSDTPAMWACISKVTESMVATVFKTISRAGCMVEELLAAPHKLAPFNLFKVLFKPEEGPAVATRHDCEQCRHPLVEHYAQQYGDQLGCLQSRMQLYLLLSKGVTDISKLEALHAWIRRLIYSRPHTHGNSLEHVSAHWCCKRHRAGLPPEKRKAPVQCIEDEPNVPAKKKQKRHNGFHLYCRQVLVRPFGPQGLRCPQYYRPMAYGII